MTLFSGLLCFSGIEEGCAAVEQAQNETTGQWYRSPRLRAFPRLRRVNTFSPDMALGVQLWSIAKHRTSAQKMQWWLDWIGRNQRCVGVGCQKRQARFCPDDDVDGDPDAVAGCAFRVIDAAPLAAVSKFLGLKIADAELNETLERWLPGVVSYTQLDALNTAVGYPQHLAAVRILMLWQLGYDDPALDAAATHLAKSQPANAFFAWLSGAPAESVATLALARCPKRLQDIPATHTRSDWIWQRKDDSSAPLETMLWDCRFVAALVKNNVLPRSRK